MPKLIIQIPCLNEEASLASTLRELPRELDGIERIEWLVIDDGSTDRTAAVARDAGADHVITRRPGRSLAQAFAEGLRVAVDRGADIVVNTDADNQYRAAFIPALIAPVLEGRADMVIGERPIELIAEFSPLKKRLQRVGSRVVAAISGAPVRDATSGFRAFSRDAASRLTIFDRYTYTLETLLQARVRGIRVATVDVGTNPTRRSSRLVRSIPSYLWHSAWTIARCTATYRSALPAPAVYGRESSADQRAVFSAS